MSNTVFHPMNQKIPPKYITSPVKNTIEGNSILDDSQVNSSLHNIPVNRIYMNMSF
jgi:hypothetical protein